MYFPRQIRLVRIAPLRHTLALTVVDGTLPDRHFELRAEAAAPDAPPDATIAGPPETVLLLLWKRITLDDAGVTVNGSEAVAREVLATDLTP